ncbi:MAG: hypothetical protein JXA73_13485 [Acidobacteria bacterium]|nr:hypothetical protein [Acidobacteriota bacterium]
MKNSKRFFVGCSLLILVACSSCGVPSSEAERNAALEAMENAKSFHAEELAASDWLDAMKAWEQGEAAVKEGKSAKTFFTRAKSRFEKTAAIAKSQSAVWSRDVADMQLSIMNRFSKVKAALERGRMSSRIKKQVQAIAAEIDQDIESLDGLASKGEFVKGKKLAQEIQAKIYNAELVMAGKKPVS